MSEGGVGGRSKENKNFTVMWGINMSFPSRIKRKPHENGLGVLKMNIEKL